ncbi:hypothetical protein FB567DRAFT_591637 [Paraphoma chrysanthemicola]|uniref:Uncharacterized protein n=1 Tax=Paraphoma chrysanthemicola TaxID=798071 RepID=A0A8K0R902_9PLEO|nr:hypothetical protein FB567DRAFT_591637 [Paraphoma chrysanthemicola]
MSSIITEKYGPSSYFRKFVKGKTCTMDCETLITNSTIMAREKSFAADNESPEESTAGAALSQRYLDVATGTQAMWVEADNEGLKVASQKRADAVSNREKVRLGRRVAHYRELASRHPECSVDVNTINDVAEARAALVVPLYGLPQEARADV